MRVIFEPTRFQFPGCLREKFGAPQINPWSLVGDWDAVENRGPMFY